MLSYWERRCAPGACVHTGVMMGAGKSSGRHSPTPSPDTGTGVTRRSPRTKGNQSPRSASGAGARSALISTAAAGALESPSLAHGLFVTARPQFQPPCSVSGWLASHLTYRRPSTVLGPGPPVGAVPDTLGENTHA